MTLNWSDTSRDDLRTILAYVGANFGRRKAEEALADIRERAEQLTSFPKLGRVFRWDRGLSPVPAHLLVESTK